MNNNIVLIGFMGSGKTSFGKWLSRTHNMNFVDTDEYIVKQQGRTINDIFAAEGEDYFRDLETETVKKLSTELDNCVVSVGGGLPVREVNRGLLKKLGTVIYLSATSDELVKRLSRDNTRPLLKGGNLKQKIETLMKARESIYIATADINIDTVGKSFEQMYIDIQEESKNEIISD